jgi:hypothetical protein
MGGDATKRVYKEFGVEASLSFVPKTLWSALRGLASGRLNLNMKNGPHGLPADFLIVPDGRIVAVKYGTHAYDQWSAQELITLANTVDTLELANDHAE